MAVYIKLSENIRDLCHQIMVLQCGPVPAVPMLQVIPQIFLDIESFILYLPAFPSRTCYRKGIFIRKFYICDPLESYPYNLFLPYLLFLIPTTLIWCFL